MTGNQDWAELQGLIDEAVKTNGIVNITRNYVIDKPLIACKWDPASGTYKTFTIQILGRSTMWDVGNISQITYTGKNSFALGIHLGKGVVVRGINFQGKYTAPAMTDAQFFQSNFDSYGDPTCRDSRYSPHAAIVIDPFRSSVPADGGYPELTEYYRGSGGGGSTGFFIDHCTFNNFTCGLVFSPNGQTANCELMTVSNIRIYNTKAGIVGCQAQEKSNKFFNINCWGRTHTLFVWNKYGSMTPGYYTIDGVQIAGGVVRLVNRSSGGYFPLNITNVFAEMLGQIGYWMSNVGDRLSNSTISLVAPENAGGWIYGGVIHGQQNNKTGMTIENCNIRYYGKPTYPLLLNGAYVLINNTFDVPPMTGYKSTDPGNGYYMGGQGEDFTTAKLKTAVAAGSFVALCVSGSWIWEGLATVDSDGLTLKYIPLGINTALKHGRTVYNKI